MNKIKEELNKYLDKEGYTNDANLKHQLVIWSSYKNGLLND